MAVVLHASIARFRVWLLHNLLVKYFARGLAYADDLILLSATLNGL